MRTPASYAAPRFHPSGMPSGTAIPSRQFWGAPPLLASQARRSGMAPLILSPSVILTGIAYTTGNAPFLSDMGFLWMTACCLVFLLAELWHFKHRQGWGACTMYLGILAWFCHDYMTHWFNEGPWARDYPDAMPTIGKMAFLYCTFVTLMAFGLTLKVPDRVARWIHRYPEPRSHDFLFWIACITFILNIAFYKLFSYGNLYETLWSLYFGGRRGQIGFSVGMGGNLTTNFSGYLVMVAGTIGVGGHAAAAYLVFARKNFGKKMILAIIWLHALMLAYGGGTRSQLLFQGASIIVFLVIYAFQNPHLTRKTLVLVAAFCLVILGGIQIQSFFRNQAYDIDLSDKRLTTELSGNTMFSEALDAYQEIPSQKPFFHDQNFPGEGAVRALPQMAFWFAIGPVPRPLLNMVGMEKPIDPAWAYRAEDQAGTGAKNMGTTSSYGLVGAWYFRFGFLGMLEGAIVMGWMYALTERWIRSVTLGRVYIMRLIISFSILITLLLFYRDVVFFAVWPLILTFVGMGIIIRYWLPHQADRA